MKHIFLLGALLFWPVAAWSGEIYSFIDAHGVRHFTDQPPAAANSRKVKLKPSLGTVKIYKCIDNNGQIHYTDRPKNSCYKLIYESGDFSSFSTDDYQGSSRIHRRFNRYKDLVEEIAHETLVEPELLHAVIQTESAYNPKAVSPKGAVGLMQLMPGTAKRYGVHDRTDVSSNLYGGARYLNYLLKLFNNNLKLALAGYNAGENAVIRYGYQIPPYRETRNYVRKVLALYQTHLSNKY